MLDWSQLVTVSGLTAASRMVVSLAAVADVDDNDVEEIERITLSASYSAPDQARIDANFATPVSGTINLMMTVL